MVQGAAPTIMRWTKMYRPNVEQFRKLTGFGMQSDDRFSTRLCEKRIYPWRMSDFANTLELRW